MKKLLVLLAAFVLFSNYSFSQNKLDGSYKGAIIVMGMNLDVVVNFKTENDSYEGIIDLQGVKGLKLTEIKYEHPAISFVLPNPNEKNNAYFDGTVYADSISGTFKQSTVTGTFFLVPYKETADTTRKVELPYKEEEVTFKNGDNTFSGTLTIPFNEGKHPAVIMITGSGPQDRNEEILGFKIFGIIADYFTRNGIAVLRYDDRNVNKSKGTDVNQSTTEDFAYDVIEAVKFLKTRNDINPEQIGLYGHSEGGIVGPLAASKNSDIAFVIMMAGTGVKGGDIIVEQSSAMMKANGETDSNINASIDYTKRIISTIVNNGDLVQLQKDLKEEFLKGFDEIPEETKKTITDKEEYAQQRAEGTIAMFSSPWMKFFLDYDPYPALLKVKCPVLALFGELDLQVLPSQNEPPVKEALTKSGNPDFTVKIFPKANHLFQTATNGSPKEYGTLKKEFVEGYLEYVTDWIIKRVTIQDKKF